MVKATTTARARKSVEETETLVLVPTLKPATWVRFDTLIIGDTPLIAHAWSAKAKGDMLEKQEKRARPGRAKRDPDAEFGNSLYRMADGYGFPAMALKKACLTVANKDKGLPKTVVMVCLRIFAKMYRVHTAHSGAVCDMPLLRIYGTEPECREDMVRVGAGLNKTASLAYRAQFESWALLVPCEINTDVLTVENFRYLLSDAGSMCGLGDWRQEKSGVFGSFHIATEAEEKVWKKFIDGGCKGAVPKSTTLAAV